jgi:hypothetical protein
MSVVTRSAIEPAAEAFTGFSGTERQKRELRRLQLLDLHNVQKPDPSVEMNGDDVPTRRGTLPTASPPLPSAPPAAASTCDFEDADAVRLQRCILSMNLSSETGRYQLAHEILNACSKIIQVPAENVVQGPCLLECACHRQAALDRDMSPGQQLWFSKVANKQIVRILLDVAQSSETDETRELICSSLERIAFFESGRFVITSEGIVPILLRMADHICHERAVVAILRIFPAFLCGIRTARAREAFVKLANATLHLGCPHLELLFVAFRQLTCLTEAECDLINDENRAQILNDARNFLMRKSLASVLTRAAAQLDYMSSGALDSLGTAFFEFSRNPKGVKLLSNDTVASAILRILIKIDDPRICYNMICNLTCMLPYIPKSQHSEVLQAICHCSTVTILEPSSFDNGFNINILSILKIIAVDYFDSIDGLQQTVSSIFRPFAVTLLRMAACTEGWVSIQDKKGFEVHDKHHVLNCKMAVLCAASHILRSFCNQLCLRDSVASSDNLDNDQRVAQLLQLQCSADEIGSNNPEFQTIESLLLSCSAKTHRMFRHVRDDHLKDEKLSSHVFYLLRLRSFLYPDNDPKLESNNHMIFAALSQLPFSEFSKKRAQDVQCILLIVQTAFSSRQFGDFFERQISSVDCHNFQSVSRLFAIISGISDETDGFRAWNEFWRSVQYRVFNNLIGFLISSHSDASSSGKPGSKTCPQPHKDEFQAVFTRIKVVNWNGSEVVVSFTADFALSDLAISACEAFGHRPGAFDIVCGHSRSVYTPADVGIQLSQAGLVPTGKVHLQERNDFPLAEIKIVDLAGVSVTVHFEVTATLNDIACYVRDNRRPFDYYKKYPKKSFCIIANDKSVFAEASFLSTSLLQAGLLPSGKISFKKMKKCCIGFGCEAEISDFLKFASTSVAAGSPLFNADTATLLISLLPCSLCSHAQEIVIALIGKLLPVCSEYVIVMFRNLLCERIDEWSKINIRCMCDRGYDSYFSRMKDGLGNKLMNALQILWALPNVIDDADFFEIVDRIAMSRTHLYRHTLWGRLDIFGGKDSVALTESLADYFLDNLQDLISLLGRTSPQSPDFIRCLSKILTIAISKHRSAFLSSNIMKIYVSAICNSYNPPSRWCTDSALIAAYIFSMHLEKERSNFWSERKGIKASNWDLLKTHFQIVADIFNVLGDAILAPMINVCSQFIEASCVWFGPDNVRTKRNLNSELGEARLNSLISTIIVMTSHCNYLSLDASARFVKAVASRPELNQRLTAAVPVAILKSLLHYSWAVQSFSSGTYEDEDGAKRMHAFEALNAMVPLSHLHEELLTPGALEMLSQLYCRDEEEKVLDIFESMQAFQSGRESVGESLHTVAAVLHALNNVNGAVQSKALKILAAGLQAPASLVWLRASGLKNAVFHLAQLARSYFCVDGKRGKPNTPRVDDSLFSSDDDLHHMVSVLSCCSSRVLMFSDSRIEVDLEAIFDIRDLLVLVFDMLNNKTRPVASSSIIDSVIRVMTATPPALVSEHILSYFDDNSGSVPTRVLCVLNELANHDSGILMLCTAEMKACLLKVGRNPVVASCLELIHTQEANENLLHLESLKPEYDYKEASPSKKRPFYSKSSNEIYIEKCHKFEALKEQRLNGLAHSRSLYQLIGRLASYDQNSIFFDEDVLCLLLASVRPHTNLCAVRDILFAVRFVLGGRSRADTHAAFSIATFGKLRRFLFVVIDKLQRVSLGVNSSEYSKVVKASVWRDDICDALQEYVALLLQLYPFRAFRRVLTESQPHLGGIVIIPTVVEMLSNGTKESSVISANPFDLLSRMLLSPKKKQQVAICFQQIMQIVTDDQSEYQQKYLVFLKRYSYFFPSGTTRFPHSSAIAFVSNFAREFPDLAAEYASQISNFGSFTCRMASYVDPPIFTETCDFVVQLLRSSLSGSAYTQFASAAFEDLAAMCELALPPPSTSDRRVELDFDDKCAVVQLMQTVASCGELSGDSITLALLRLIWSCSSSEEIQHVAQPAQTLLLGMGVTKDNFFHVLPKHPQPITADTQCYLEDQCCADEQSLDYQVDCCLSLLIPSDLYVTYNAACVRPCWARLLHVGICFHQWKVVRRTRSICFVVC